MHDTRLCQLDVKMTSTEHMRYKYKICIDVKTDVQTHDQVDRLIHGRSWVRFSPGHTKDHQENGTNCLPALHACVRVGVLTKQPDCLNMPKMPGSVWNCLWAH